MGNAFSETPPIACLTIPLHIPETEVDDPGFFFQEWTQDCNLFPAMEKDFPAGWKQQVPSIPAGEVIMVLLAAFRTGLVSACPVMSWSVSIVFSAVIRT